MTTSRQPWTIFSCNKINELHFIKDADGKVIGWFQNWQDAELIIKLQDEVNELKRTVEGLEDQLAEANSL